jgi:carbon monoxide dehydrogenase subunit G
MRYGEGFITGTGEWRLVAEAGGTRVAYALDVSAHGWLVALLGRLLPLGRVHSRSMRQVLANLEAEVRRRG